MTLSCIRNIISSLVTPFWLCSRDQLVRFSPFQKVLFSHKSQVPLVPVALMVSVLPQVGGGDKKSSPKHFTPAIHQLCWGVDHLILPRLEAAR